MSDQVTNPKNLDQVIKETLAGYEVPLDSTVWEEMHKKLEAPQTHGYKKGSSTLYLLIFLAFVSVGLLIYYFVPFNSPSKKESIPNKKAVVAPPAVLTPVVVVAPKPIAVAVQQVVPAATSLSKDSVKPEQEVKDEKAIELKEKQEKREERKKKALEKAEASNNASDNMNKDQLRNLDLKPSLVWNDSLTAKKEMPVKIALADSLSKSKKAEPDSLKSEKKSRKSKRNNKKKSSSSDSTQAVKGNVLPIEKKANPAASDSLKK